MMRLFARFRREMSCDEVLGVMQSYLDGETDVNEARRVAGHLGRCGHCDQEADVYKHIKVSLRRRQTSVDPQVLEALAEFGLQVSRGDEPR